MTDQCKHCILRGNLKECLQQDCSKHEDWVNTELLNIIEENNRVLAIVDKIVYACDSDVEKGYVNELKDEWGKNA